MKKLFTSIVICLLFCSNMNAQQQNRFPKVKVPAMYADQAARMDYMTAHFWDKFDFRNTSQYAEGVLEQGVADFLYSLYGVPYNKAVAAINKMMGKAEVSAESYEKLLEIWERYTYNPNSPMRNDEYFIPAVEHYLASKTIDEDNKLRYRSLIKLITRNRPGTKATDFTYTLANKKQGKMSGIESDFLVLFFYNPDCPACGEIKEMLELSQPISELREAGHLKVLALYTDGDLVAWKKHLPENPLWWISAYDKGTIVLSNEVYDLKAIPTLYLLDKDKNVILKDPTPQNMEQWIVQNLSD